MQWFCVGEYDLLFDCLYTSLRAAQDFEGTRFANFLYCTAMECQILPERKQLQNKGSQMLRCLYFLL